MKVRYIKEKTILIPCPICKGKGTIEEKVYQKQFKNCCCYKCAGSGKVEMHSQKDVTSEIAHLRNRVRRLKTKVS